MTPSASNLLYGLSVLNPTMQHYLADFLRREFRSDTVFVSLRVPDAPSHVIQVEFSRG
jgi:hypothetical protein